MTASPSQPALPLPAAALAAWPVEAIAQAARPWLPGLQVHVLARIDSTNTELMRRARAGDTTPTLLVAHQQTAGRGRLGRSWQSSATPDAPPSPASEAESLPALTFSLGLPLAPRDWSGLSLAVGVSVAESLETLGGPPPQPDAHATVVLKWPNDLWLPNGRKLGGILVETAGNASQTAEQARYVVVGIGINLAPLELTAPSTTATPANTPAYLRACWPNATAPATLACLAAPLIRTLLEFAEHGFAPLQARFAHRDHLRGRPVVLSDGSHGQAEGVADDGALLVRGPQGLRSITSSEVSVRPAPPSA